MAVRQSKGQDRSAVTAGAYESEKMVDASVKSSRQERVAIVARKELEGTAGRRRRGTGHGARVLRGSSEARGVARPEVRRRRR